MRRKILLQLAVMALVLAAGSVVFAQEGPPPVAAIDSGESMPDGCTSCHMPVVPGPDGPMDVRLSVVIPQLYPDHPDLTERVAEGEIPGLCNRCHNGRMEPELGPIVHRVHFQTHEDRDNHFQSMFGGQCLMCHTLDVETGEMGVKNGTEVAAEAADAAPEAPAEEATE